MKAQKLLLPIGGLLALAIFIRRKKMIYPVIGYLTSKFGQRTNPITGESEFHNGIDIGANEGTNIKSPADGEVINQYYNSKGGKQMIIKHNNGYTSGYAHLQDYLVSIGDKVKKEQNIATVGRTGTVTGPHLHFTLKDISGNYIDPQKYLV